MNFLGLIGSVRDRYIYHFRPKYFLDQLQKKDGQCDGCISCCVKNRPFCPYITPTGCKIYKSNIPFFCKIFPIDQKSKRLSKVEKECRYRWLNEEDWL